MKSDAPAHPPKTLARRLRNLAVNFLVLFITLCLCLLMGELVACWRFPQFNPKAQFRLQVMPGPFAICPPLHTLWHGSPKGDFNVPMTFNRYGFRDAKDVRDAKDGDWFAVGDSFTLGFGVEEDKRYSSLLEKKLQAAGSPSRVFNIGIPGNFIDYQRLVKYAESNGAKIQHLTVGVCMDNDLENYSAGKSDWELVPLSEATLSAKEKIRRWLQRHSTLYITVSYLIESNPKGCAFMQKIGWAKDLVAWDAAIKSQFDETVLKTSRDELVKLCSGRDAVVLIIPSRRLWLGNGQVDEKIHTTFVQMCRDAGLTVADVKPVLEKDPEPLSFYFKHDQHWNERGQAAGAEELFKAIQNRVSK